MDQVEEVVSKVDLVELINSYVALKKAGRNFKAVCPFHSEKTPSFIVSPELQIFKCFGCQVGGNAIKFLQEYEKMDFGEALRFLADKVGVKLRDYRPDKQQLVKDRLLGINHLASEYYHYVLTSHSAGKKALTYLRSRGINNQSIKSFKLGYAPSGWENLTTFLVRKKGYKVDELSQVGLIIKGKGYYDRFRDRIVFPIFDHRGNIVGFSGRVLEAEVKEAKYINTPETPLYHKSLSLYGLYQSKEAIKKDRGVILVEGEFDVISSHQVGVKNIVAIKGSALTTQQVEILKRFTENLAFCLDADRAGEEAAKRGIEIAEAAGLNIRVVSLSAGKDADEAIRSNPSAWKAAVKKTIPVYDFYLQSALSTYGIKTGEDKKRLTEEVLPLLNKITNEVEKIHYFKKLAELLDIPQETINKEAQRQSKLKKVYPLEKPVKKPAPKSRKEVLEEYLLSLTLHTAGGFVDLMEKLDKSYLTTPAIKRVFSFLQRYAAAKPKKFQISKFVKMIPEELRETVNRLFLADLKGLDENQQKLVKEWQKTWQQVEKLYLHDKLGRLKKILADRQKSSQEKKKAEEEIVKVVKQLKT